MSTLTLDRVLTEVEALSPDEQTMLEELLRGRRTEAWRRDTAADAKKSIPSRVNRTNVAAHGGEPL